MKKIVISLYFVIALLVFTVVSCNKDHLCSCSTSIGNEVVDSAAWNDAGNPLCYKSGIAIEPKMYIFDTILQSDPCESLNFYDSVGTDKPEYGLRLHVITTCTEK